MADSYVYAGAGMWRGGSMSGVFRRRVGDGGFEQMKAGLPAPTSVHTITVHPLHPERVFIGTQDGPYLSEDHGAHWRRPDFPDHVQIWSFLVHPLAPETIFAGASPVALYRSDDGGAHWRLLARPTLDERAKMPFACRVMRIALDPNAPRDLYATVEVNGVMKSHDGGESWIDCNDALVRLADQPHLKSKLVSGTEAEGMLDGHALCVSAAAPGTVFLACRMGLFRSSDRGEHWSDIEVGRFSPLTYARDIRPAPQDPTRLYACLSVHATGDTGSLATSDDLGATWRRIDHGVPIHATVMQLALHPRDPDQVYGAARNGQIIGTEDGGKSWQEHRLPEGCADVYGIACG
ncbi:MAG TPA: hypothetical protein VGL83_07125 [Stellaceae bacterium]|jgi:photosystem II stability/assembly factor-like uncharacterized protein